jgi:hypothetical protein
MRRDNKEIFIIDKVLVKDALDNPFPVQEFVPHKPHLLWADKIWYEIQKQNASSPERTQKLGLLANIKKWR